MTIRKKNFDFFFLRDNEATKEIRPEVSIINKQIHGRKNKHVPKHDVPHDET